MTIVCIILFLLLSIWQIKVVTTSTHCVTSPYCEHDIMQCSSAEMLMIVLFATAYIGLSPVLALRLAFLEVLVLYGLMRSEQRAVFSIPIIIFFVFLAWLVVGLFYTPNKMFGVRMILKYIYPLLIALFASSAVRDEAVFMKSGMMARKVATFGIVTLFLPGVSMITGTIFWYVAAFITGLIPIIMFSFALADFNYERKKNLRWGLFLSVFCILAAFRTDIFGTYMAVATYSLIKYRLKAVPYVALMGLAGLLVMFYVPSIKSKMFINPDKANIVDYMTFNIDENNVQTNMRKFMWEDATKRFYKGHELVGSGTGRVQTFFYNEATDARRGGQLHNDFLVLRCDNGQIGFWMFILSYVAILLHCIQLYHRSPHDIVRMAALVSGSSLIGVFVTMFSDNTLSYSMVTLSFPWGFYGMTLGLNQRYKDE